MNRILVALLAFLLLFISACREDDITGIVKRCNETNANLHSFTSKTIDLTGVTTEGGSITGYFNKKNELVMATVASYGQSGRAVQDYYYDDDKVECVIRQDYTYNKPMYYTDAMAKDDGDTSGHGGYDDSKTILKTSRFYFYNDNMVKWYDTSNKLVPDNDRKYQFQAGMILDEADKLQRMLKPR